MTALRSTLRRALPASERKRLRHIHRTATFRATMFDFRRHPENYRHADNPKLAKLIYGWGNADWSGWQDFLAGCVNETLDVEQGAILECGTGLSTLLIGSIATERRLPHIALEHHATWAADMQAWCRRYNLDTEVVHAPLAESRDYDWYDTKNLDLPAKTALVVCDGPPGDTRGGRSGAVDKLASSITTGTRLLIDDADRPAELELAERWAHLLNSDYQLIGSRKPYARIVAQ